MQLGELERGILRTLHRVSESHLIGYDRGWRLAITRLCLGKKLIEACPSPGDTVRRRKYRLTEKGKSIAAAVAAGTPISRAD